MDKKIIDKLNAILSEESYDKQLLIDSLEESKTINIDERFNTFWETAIQVVSERVYQKYP